MTINIPITNLNVMLDAGDNFISGWKLTSAQVFELTTTGDIGVDKYG